MAATLRYAAVVDRARLLDQGGLTPATDNVVTLTGDAPTIARDFIVQRAYDDVDSGFEERWHLEDAAGRTVYQGTPRTVLAEHGDVYDEIQGVRFDYADDDYQLVLHADGMEVARTPVAVVADDTAAPATGIHATPPDAQILPPDAAVADDQSGGGGRREGDDGDRTAELGEGDDAVFVAVSRLEAEGGPAFLDDIAAAADVDTDTARAALSRLVGELDLVQQVSTGQDGGPDLGRRYRVKARP